LGEAYEEEEEEEGDGVRDQRGVEGFLKADKDKE
jgi:hypothetical protein